MLTLLRKNDLVLTFCDELSFGDYLLFAREEQAPPLPKMRERFVLVIELAICFRSGRAGGLSPAVFYCLVKMWHTLCKR